jgi:hypothetical protein
LGLRRFKNKIVGFILVLCMLVSAYTVIVQAVQQFDNISLITQLSLLGSNGAAGNGTQFYAGETLSIRASVSAGDVYSVSIYGKNGSVYNQNGWIRGSVAVVQVPLNPPSFRANESYVVSFSAYISVYPIPGAFATDTKLAGFTVQASNTTLGLSCDYDDTLHALSVSAALVSGQDAPVANKTINLYLQLNTSSYVQDRGWLPLASEQTDANGQICYVTGCSLFSGIQYVKAEFAGDSDFGGSSNTTRFTVAPSSPVIQSVNVTDSAGVTEYVVEVTDSNGYPLMGKTVAIAPQDSTDPEYAVTDAEGTAHVTLNDSALSEATQNITVLGDMFTRQSELSCGSSGYTAPSSLQIIHLPSDAPQASQSTGNVTVSISPANPYAILRPVTVNATYNGSSQPGWVNFCFLLDDTQELSFLHVLSLGNGTIHASLLWCPDVVGIHSINVSVSGAASAEGYVDFDVASCPDNLQLYAPQVVYGNQAMFSLVFTMPTLIHQNTSMLFSSFDTAPTVTNISDGQVYKVEWGVNSTTVSLSLNGSSVGARALVTNGNGVACISFPVNMTKCHATLVFYANKTDNPLYENQVLNRTVSYSRVSTSAGVNASQWDKNGSLTLGCSVAGGNATSSQVYVGAASSAVATAGLFGMPVYNAPVNLTFAEFVPTSLPTPYNKTAVAAGSLAYALNVTRGANFLRVAYIYTNPCLDADIAPYKLSQSWSAVCDGVVNLKDTGLITGNWQKRVANGADPLADINHDGIVNLKDLSKVTSYFGKRGSYLPSFGAVAHFSDGNASSLDSAGCVSIPNDLKSGKGTVWFTLKNGTRVGAFVEFFRVVNQSSELNMQSQTDTSGTAEFSWTPSATGEYLVEVKLPQQFNATVSQTEPASVCEPICTVSYVRVVQRPLTLNLAAEDTAFSMNIPACSATYISETESNENFGGASLLELYSAISDDVIHGQTWIFLNFNLYQFFKNVSVTSAALTLHNFYYGYLDAGDVNRTYGVYPVLNPWSESSLCWNNADTSNPDYNQRTPLATQTVDLNTLTVGSNVTWDLTSAFGEWSRWGSGAFVYGFLIRDMNLSNSTTFVDFNSTNAGSLSPTLQVNFTAPAGAALSAYDPVLGQPASDLNVTWALNGTSQSPVQTSSTGCANLVFPVGKPLTGLVGVYNVTASYPGDNATYQPANVSWIYDYRWCSNITCQQGTAVNATVNQKGFSLGFQLFSPELLGMNLTRLPVYFYVDGALQGSGSTDTNGLVSFSGWTPPAAGTYAVTACFGGTRFFSPCNVSVCVTAQVVPVGVDFNVSSSEFAPGTGLTLTAKLINLETGDVMPNFIVQFCYNDSGGNSRVLYTGTTDSNGVATYQWPYPSNGVAYAFYAQAGATLSNQPQNMASSPVQLTVGLNTTLLLSVSRLNGSNTQVFMARLVNGAGVGLANRLLTLELNDTEHEYNATTNQTGNATWTLQLSPQANDSATIYNIAVSFAGDTPVRNAAVYLTSPDGTKCAISTTIQYTSYKPSANSTSILVWPQTTTGETSLESPDQMQADVKSSGWLNFYTKWTWSYPWYTLHAKITIETFSLDVGFSPVLPFGTTWAWQGLEIFGGVVGEIWQDIILDFVGVFGSYVIAKALGIGNIAAGLFIETIKGIVQSTFLWAYWNEKAVMLAMAIANLIMGFISLGTNVGEAFAKGLLNIMYGQTWEYVMQTTNGMIGCMGILQAVRSPVDLIESLAIDFPTFIFALLRYLGKI